MNLCRGYGCGFGVEICLIFECYVYKLKGWFGLGL